MGDQLGQVQQRAARVLRSALSSTRDHTPQRLRPIARMLRPVSSRAYRFVGTLEAPQLREAEALIRAELETSPDRSDLWHQLALSLAAQRRWADAVEAWLRAAETGGELEAVILEFQNRSEVRDLVRSEPALRRMRGIAEAHPESSRHQLEIGAFFIDQGLIEAGRELIRRGYALMLPDQAPVFLDDTAGHPASLPPSFWILGPHKAATSSLYSLMVQHPQIIPLPRKELRFWENQGDRPPEVYDAYYPPLDPKAGLISGEASPYTLASRNAVAAAVERFPDVKTIILRRDPVARAYSQYQMMRRLQIEQRDFEAALQQERFWLGAVPPLTMNDIPEGQSPYLVESCILPYVRMWTEALGAERVMVVDSRSLSLNRQDTIDAVFAYLGLPSAQISDETDRNVGEYTAMSTGVEAELRAWFAPHEAALDEFLATHPTRFPVG